MWFSESVSNILGAAMGCGVGLLAGAFGLFTGIYGSKGKYKCVILTTIIVFIIMGILMLMVGIYAVLDKQPYHVYYPFLLIGGILAFVYSSSFAWVKKRFTQIELEKMDIEDLQ